MRDCTLVAAFFRTYSVIPFNVGLAQPIYNLWGLGLFTLNFFPGTIRVDKTTPLPIGAQHLERVPHLCLCLDIEGGLDIRLLID